MAIEVQCGACFRTYRVKDERAGSKIRCKECQEVIEVPYEDDIGDFDEDDYVEEPAPVRRPKKKKRSSDRPKKRKPKRSQSSGDVVPVWRRVLGLPVFLLGITILGFAIYGLVTGELKRVRVGGFIFAGVCISVGLKWMMGQVAE